MNENTLSNPPSNPVSDITAEACAWIAQLETGDLTPADLEAFREWTHRSPRHSAEIKRLARLSADLNVLTAMAQPLRDAAAHYRPVIRGGKQRSSMTLPRLTAFAAVASVVVAAVLILAPRAYLPWSPTVLATTVGGYEEETLSDGTVVKLNTDSLIEVDYDRQERRVHLRKGEAFFQVAHNPDRPFVVLAGGKAVRAVGTAFAVHWDQTDLEVTVTEGRVALADMAEVALVDMAEIVEIVETDNIGTHGTLAEYRERASSNQPSREGPSRENANQETSGQSNSREPNPGQPAPGQERQHSNSANKTPVKSAEPIILQAGQRLVVSTRRSATAKPALETAAIEIVLEDELRRKLAWRQGLFDFSDTPLDEVIREVNRHTTLNIEIADPALRKLKFGGIFPTGDTELLLDALKTAFGIEVVYVDNSTVRLSHPPQA